LMKQVLLTIVQSESLKAEEKNAIETLYLQL
jgi:hypothetical protein